MIDIEKICNTKLEKFPWEHKVVDNFFPQEVFDKIKTSISGLAKISKNEEYHLIFANESTSFGVSDDVIEDIITATDDILDNINLILKDFAHKNDSTAGYYCLPKFGVTGRDFEYPIHEDSNHKVILFIIYLDPVEELGTMLYTEDDKHTPVKCIEWKPNRAVIMCPNDGHTWHNWKNAGSDHRITLNIFCEKLEVLDQSLRTSSNGDDDADIIWLYEQFNKNRLTTNKYD
jgi:hypothetical protein